MLMPVKLDVLVQRYLMTELEINTNLNHSILFNLLNLDNADSEKVELVELYMKKNPHSTISDNFLYKITLGLLRVNKEILRENINRYKFNPADGIL
jgi:hypothetical protein